MMDWLLSVYNDYMNLTRSNPVIAGVVSLWGLGVLTYLCKHVPLHLFEFVKRQFITSLVFDNAGSEDYSYHKFMEYVCSNIRFSRAFSLKRYIHTTGKIGLGPGYGTHYFFHNGRLFWFTRRKEDSQGSYFIKEAIVISTIGRSNISILDLINTFLPETLEIKLPIFEHNKEEWELATNDGIRPIETVVLNDSIKSKLITTIDKFLANPDWYRDRGISYKLSFLLEGIPGTGKSSIVRAIASYYKKPLFSLNLGIMTNKSLVRALRTVPAGSILLIEDIDTVTVTHARNDDSHDERGIDKLSLGTLLNTMNGVVGLNDIIIFNTTNHIEKLDPALIRKGRVDHIINIPKLSNTEIREYGSMVFPDYDDESGVIYKDIAGCELESLFLSNSDDPLCFYNSIPVIEDNVAEFHKLTA